MNKLRPAASVNWLKALSIFGTAAAAAGLVLLEPEPSDMLMFTAAIAAIVAIVVSGVDCYAGRIARKIREN